MSLRFQDGTSFLVDISRYIVLNWIVLCYNKNVII